MSSHFAYNVVGEPDARFQPIFYFNPRASSKGLIKGRNANKTLQEVKLQTRVLMCKEEEINKKWETDNVLIIGLIFRFLWLQLPSS